MKKKKTENVVAHKILDFLIINPFTQIPKYCNKFNGEQINWKMLQGIINLDLFPSTIFTISIIEQSMAYAVLS